MLVGLATLIQADSRVATATIAADADNTLLTITGTTGYILEAGTLTDSLGNITAANVVSSSELFITEMANNGTVELTAAGLGTTVTMADATGATDSLNIVTAELATVNVGTVSVAGVETVNVTTTDLFTDTNDDGADDVLSAVTLNVAGDDLETLNVDGAGDLSLDTQSTTVTAVDASDMTGILTYTADGATAGTTVTGGAGNDVLTAAGSSDVLNGGAGDDTLTGADLSQLTGGAGVDTFMMNTASNSNSYSTITDLQAGDVIDLDAGNGGTVAFTSAAVVLAGTAAFQDYATAAANSLGTDINDAAYFQFSGNTFIVQSGDTGATNGFVAGTDSIIGITGLVDLSSASYNLTNGTLEIA
jgi:hypothetical protein